MLTSQCIDTLAVFVLMAMQVLVIGSLLILLCVGCVFCLKTFQKSPRRAMGDSQEIECLIRNSKGRCYSEGTLPIFVKM